ncbi:hypothetical protein AX769_05830 [Frondihabitans sp. PAMC 28766]|nr:hypothetical protein AX769_05830 [Frondihabitans sp. PAMC 28766]
MPLLMGADAVFRAAPARAATTVDFTTLRTQWLDTLIGSFDLSDTVVAKYVTDSAAVAQSLWDSLDTSASRTYLWSDLNSSTTSAIQTTAAGRLRTLALALHSPGSSLSGNAQLQSDLTSAFDWFLANEYGPSVHSYDNWWDFEIGIPLALNDFCIVMFDDLTSTQITTATTAIAHYAPDPTITAGTTSTGANRNWACSIALVRGALSQDATVISGAKTAWETIFTYSTSGDGFYTDGGFVQHVYFAYTGGYGNSLLQYLTYSMKAASGTPWAFGSDKIAEVYTWTQNNYRPWIFGGAMMDMVRGRNLSRFYDTDHRSGRLALSTLVQLASVLPAAQAATVNAETKGWIAADTAQPYFTYDSAPIEQVRLASIVQGRALATNTGVTAVGESISTVMAPSMARAVHRRPGFAYAIAMDTAAIHPYEAGNLENQQGWYTGEGAVYLYLPNELAQFTNEFWPTVDKYRIPGTTLDTKTLSDGVGRTTTNTWAGGALLDGRAAVGMGLSFSVQTLVGKKSWFCIDDVIVCLGAGITSTDGRDIQTIVENRNIGPNGSVTPVIDGQTVLTMPSSAPTAFTPRWAWIPGQCGYVFPEGTTIQAVREDLSGQWTDMDLRGVYDDDTDYTRRFISFWLDHGVSPTNASYSYIQMPGATQAATSAMATSTDILTMANTAQVQAVTQTSTGITLANFWSASAPKAAGITVSQPVSVVVIKSANAVDVAVSDPTQQLTGSVTVTIDGAVTSTTAVDPGVTVEATSPNLTISVALSGSAGRSFVARFAK